MSKTADSGRLAAALGRVEHRCRGRCIPRVAACRWFRRHRARRKPDGDLSQKTSDILAKAAHFWRWRSNASMFGRTAAAITEIK